MDKLLDTEHNELLKKGISNFPELSKQIQEYLHQQQLKQKQHMKDIQAPYTAAEQTKEKEQEHIWEQHKQEQAQEMKRQHKQAIERASMASEQHQKNETQIEQAGDWKRKGEKERQNGAVLKSSIGTSTITSLEIVISSPDTDITTPAITKT